MPKSKRKRRIVKNKTLKETYNTTFTITGDTVWLLRNFLTRWEKMALIEFYRNKISEILKHDYGEHTRDSSDVHDLKRYGNRIKFIMDHF